jgi:SAM-dependent methyltransferase
VKDQALIVSKHYLGDRGKKYSQGNSVRYLGHKLQAEFFQPFIQDGQVVLDLGCGKGALASYIKCSRIDGLDVNPHQLKVASQYLTAAYSEYSDVPLSFYDVVYSNHALEHVRSPMVALENVLRWLKPGGIAVFIVPHDCVCDSKQAHWDANDFAHHLYTWTPRSFANLFKEAGFVVEQCKVLKSAWHPKLFWLHRIPAVGRLSRRFLSWVLHSRQVLCVARKT